MSNLRLLMPAAALGLGIVFAGGLTTAHAQQAGATDPTIYNTSGPGASNDTRPTLLLPQHAPTAAAERPADTAAVTGWSNYDGKVLASNNLFSRLAQFARR